MLNRDMPYGSRGRKGINLGARRAAAVGLVLAAFSSLAIVLAVPSVDDFSLENPYWNGLSSASTRLGISVRPGAGLPDPAATALLVIGPDSEFSPARVSEIRGYLESGGVVVLMDDFGEGNSLLEGLGVPFRINGSVLLDPLFMHKAKHFPEAFPVGGGDPEVLLDYASAVELSNEGAGSSQVLTLLESSPFSYLDLDGDGEHTAGEPVGPFPVAVEFQYGKGRLVVVSDSSLLINSVCGASAGNAEFISRTAGARALFVDYGNNVPSAYASLRSGLLSAAGAVAGYPELRYLAAVAGAWALFSTDPRSAASWLTGKSTRGGKAEGRTEAEDEGGGDEEYRRASEEHPDWDRETLRRTWDELRLIGAGAAPGQPPPRTGRRSLSDGGAAKREAAEGSPEAEDGTYEGQSK